MVIAGLNSPPEMSPRARYRQMNDAVFEKTAPVAKGFFKQSWPPMAFRETHKA